MTLPWTEAFAASPDVAVDRMLRELVIPDRLGPQGPIQRLVRWAQAHPPERVSALDTACVNWVSRTWHEVPHDNASARRLARAWLNLFDLCTALDDVKNVRTVLRLRVADRESYLGPLSEGPSLDPVGRFLLAVGRAQPNDELAPYWWNICNFPRGVAPYHLSYAVQGVAGLPGDQDQRLVAAVRRVGVGLARAVAEGRLERAIAKTEFLTVAGLAATLAPSSERDLLSASPDLPDEVQKWLGGPKTSATKKRRPLKGPRGPRPDPGWSHAASQIARALRFSQADAVAEARGLLSTQRAYGITTGDLVPYTVTLCNFARSTWDQPGGPSLEWAEEARLVSPTDAYAWNTLTRSLLKANQHQEAVLAGWQAVERFPQNEIAWNDLGAALGSSGRLLEAQEVFHQSAERFPDRPYGWRGLGDILRRRGDYGTAESVYREALSDHCLDNAYLIDGLANVLKATGRYEESVAEYERALEINPKSAHSWRGLAMAYKAIGRLDQSIETFESGLAACPGEEYLARGLARLRQDVPPATGEREIPDARVEQTVPVPIPSAESVAALPAGEVDAFVLTARNLRRSASRTAAIAEDESQDTRGSARAIVAAVRKGREWEPRAVAEQLADASDLRDGRQLMSLLEVARSSFPAALTLALPQVQADRCLAELNGAIGAHVDFDTAMHPIEQLRRNDRSLRPIEILESFRMRLALGHDFDKSDHLKKLDSALRSADETSGIWWAPRLHSLVFNGHGESAVAERLAQNQRVIDSLEEDAVAQTLALTA